MILEQFSRAPDASCALQGRPGRELCSTAAQSARLLPSVLRLADPDAGKKCSAIGAGSGLPRWNVRLPMWKVAPWPQAASTPACLPAQGSDLPLLGHPPKSRQGQYLFGSLRFWPHAEALEAAGYPDRTPCLMLPCHEYAFLATSRACQHIPDLITACCSVLFESACCARC